MCIKEHIFHVKTYTINILLLKPLLRGYIYSAVVRSHTHVTYIKPPFTRHLYQYTDTEDTDIYSLIYEHSGEKPYKCKLETYMYN